MADNERDARLVLRAEDRATRTFEQVSKAIRETSKSLDEQAKAAARGEGSIDDLTATLRDLQRAGDDLEKGRSALRAFDRAGEAAEKAGERVARSTKAYDEYRAKLDAAGKTTEAQQRRLDTLAASVEKAQAAQDKANGRTDAARERLDKLGLSSQNTAAQIDKIVAEFNQLLPIYARAQQAVDGYAGAQERAAAATKKAASDAAQAARDAEATNSRRRAEIESSIALLAQRDKALAESAAVERKQRQTNLDAAAALAEQRQAAQADVAALRELGRAGVEASTNLNRFAQTTEGTVVGITRLGAAIRSIVSPTLSTIQSLDGAIGVVDRAVETASSRQRLRVSQYQEALNGLSQAQAAFVRQADTVDAYNRQSVALDRLEAELGQAAQKYETLARQAQAAVAPNDALVRELTEAERELNRVGTQTQQARTRFVELQTALRSAGLDTNNLAADIARLEAASRRGADAATGLQRRLSGRGGFLGLRPYELQNLSFQVNDVFTSLASGISPLQTAAQQGGQIFQILSSQITAAFNAIKPFLPALGLIAAGLGIVAYNIYEVKRATDAARGFDAVFTLSGNAAGYSAKQFGDAQLALERLGLSADDAKRVLRTFVSEGLNPEGLDTYLNTVRRISEATGIAFPEAAQKYADALNGGYKQVEALNEVTGTLNGTQLEQIRTLFDAGEAEKARTLVAEIYEAKTDDITTKARTTWSESIDKLRLAFLDLGRGNADAANTAGESKGFFEDLKGVFDRIADAINFASTALRGFRALLAATEQATADFREGGGLLGVLRGTNTGPSFNQRLREQYVRNGLTPEGALPGQGRTLANGNPVRLRDGRVGSTGGQRVIREQEKALGAAKALTDEQRRTLAVREALNRAAEEGATAAERATIKDNALKLINTTLAKEAEQRAKSAAAADRKAENAAARAAREAETRQNKINTLTRELENTYDSISSNRRDDPFAAIQKKAETAVRNIRAKFAELAKLGVTTVGGKTEADFTAGVEAARALESEQARQKKNEEDINDLLAIRKIRLGEIEDSVRQGDLTPEGGLQQRIDVLTDLNPRIQQTAQAALAAAEAFAAAHPSPQAEEFVAKLQRVLSDSAKGTTLIDVNLDALKEAQSTLDALVSRRDELVKVQTALLKAGLKTPGAAQNSIKEAFENSKPAIDAAADSVERVIRGLLAIGGLSPTVEASLQSALAGVTQTRAETKHLDADIVQLRNTAESALSGGLTDFFFAITDSIAAAIDGSKSLGEVLGDLGNAALDFAATFTRAIAQAIFQLIALKIAKIALNAVGVPIAHTGGVIGRDSLDTRKVSPLAFAGAVRYHTGGIVGTRPDEVPAILQKGEEVITANDPRHRDNGGLGGGGASPLKIVNAFDREELVNQTLNTAPGEQAVLNIIGRNPAGVRAKLGLD